MTAGRIVKEKSAAILEEYRVLGKASCEKAFAKPWKDLPPLESGSFGAGTSATVWSMFKENLRGGLGSASLRLRDGIVVGAVIAVNAFGVLDVAKMNLDFLNTTSTPDSWVESSHTVIGVVATNLKLSRNELQKVTQMAYHGIADAIFPAATM